MGKGWSRKDTVSMRYAWFVRSELVMFFFGLAGNVIAHFHR